MSEDAACQFKSYLLQFVEALKPIVFAAMGSDIELSLVRLYIQANTATKLINTYKKQVELTINGKPVWNWVVLKNDALLMQHPELLLGFDSTKIKELTKIWMGRLNPLQKETVFAWLVGMVNLAGYDITSVDSE